MADALEAVRLLLDEAFYASKTPNRRWDHNDIADHQYWLEVLPDLLLDLLDPGDAPSVWISPRTRGDLSPELDAALRFRAAQIRSTPSDGPTWRDEVQFIAGWRACERSRDEANHG